MKRGQIVRIAENMLKGLANRQDLSLFNAYFNQCQLGDTGLSDLDLKKNNRILKRVSERIKSQIQNKV